MGHSMWFGTVHISLWYLVRLHASEHNYNRRNLLTWAAMGSSLYSSSIEPFFALTYASLRLSGDGVSRTADAGGGRVCWTTICPWWARCMCTNVQSKQPVGRNHHKNCPCATHLHSCFHLYDGQVYTGTVVFHSTLLQSCTWVLASLVQCQQHWKHNWPPLRRQWGELASQGRGQGLLVYWGTSYDRQIDERW